MALLIALGVVVAAPTAHATPARTQITVLYDNGHWETTANAHESRPSLSLSKLYLGQWVLQHGAPEDKAQVEHMIRVSDDGIATRLDRKYPQAIPSIIQAYGLSQTHYSGYWGTSSTSSNDVAKFLQAIRHDPVAAPIRLGMYNVAPHGADGYPQNYGTGTLPGIQGTKYGWSNDRTINASASYGPGYVVVANTYGSAATHTQDVQAGVHINAPVAPLEALSSAHITNGADVKQRVACWDPHGLRHGIHDDWLFPRVAADAIPAC